MKILKYMMENMRKNQREKYKIRKIETLMFLNPYFGDIEDQ
jgi:hypothetical protein